jgi:hypothetical protein
MLGSQKYRESNPPMMAHIAWECWGRQIYSSGALEASRAPVTNAMHEVELLNNDCLHANTRLFNCLSWIAINGFEIEDQ